MNSASKNGEIAVKSENITKITLQLEKYKILIDKKTALEHKISLLMEILNLTKGNAFVEYVARNQLSYIIEEASSRLKSITNERYALLIDDDFKFNIRDDFNGGYVRPVNTMSGGKYFLHLSALLWLYLHRFSSRAMFLWSFSSWMRALVHWTRSSWILS